MNANTSSLDLLSKLLASENIQLVRADVNTASFDIEQRTLRIPAQMNLSEPQELLMVLHEVGHALFTTQHYIDAIRNSKLVNFDSYMNVVEDARIERLMKMRYPGARKDFMLGYAEFHRSDFFRLDGRDTAKLPFIDRINLYFKLGIHVTLRFTAEEHKLLRLVENTQTEQDVVATALAIYEFAEQQEDQQAAAPRQTVSFEDDDEDLESSSDESDGQPSPEDSVDGQLTQRPSDLSEEEVDEIIEELEQKRKREIAVEDGSESQAQPSAPQQQAPARAITQDAFDDSLTDAVMDNTHSAFGTLRIASETFVQPYKAIVEDFKEINISPERLQTYQNFKAGNVKLVNLMVQEFNMRKAAAEYKQTRVAKSGAIDANKLCQYRAADDIFQRYQISATATNHGIMILLDWSGSIDRELRELLGQVITVVEFCRRVNIKYEVYAFSTMFEQWPSRKIRHHECVEPTLVSDTSVTMLQFFTNAMTAAETDMIAKVLYTKRFYGLTNYHLNSTPLVVATAFAFENIGAFQAKYNLEKVNLVILTDGQDTTLSMYGPCYNRRVFMRDPKTNRTYLISSQKGELDRALVQRTFVRAIKDRYPFVTITGFFVSKNTRSLWQGLRHYSGQLMSADYYEFVSELFKRAKREGAAETQIPGYDRFLVMPADDSNLDLDLSGVKEDMNARQISNQFRRAFNNIRGGRIMAKSFVQTMA